MNAEGVDEQGCEPHIVAVKKKTKTTKKARKPFTCVIHGEGVDIDIRLEGTGKGNFEGLAEALKSALRPPPFVERPATPMTQEEQELHLSKDITLLLVNLNDRELTIAKELVELEVLKRSEAAPPSEH